MNPARGEHTLSKSLIVAINSIDFTIIFIIPFITLARKDKFHSHTDISMKDRELRLGRSN